MPTDQCGRLDNHQDLSPVEASGKPGQGEPSGVGRTLGFDMALLIQGQMFPREKVLGGEGSWGAKAEAKVAYDIDQEHPPWAYKLRATVKQTLKA
jgi:hypothetical protein